MAYIEFKGNEISYLQTWQCCLGFPIFDIPQDWLQDNIRDDYSVLGYYWFFKDPDDALLFKLTWC